MKSSSLQLISLPFSRYDSRAAVALGSFPQTDYDYRAPANVPATAATAKRSDSLVHAAQMRSFRQLSQQATSSGSRWQFALETAVFSLVAGLVAWSLVSLLIVLAQTARG